MLDIKANGKPDIFGIYRAKNETFLKTIEIFIICLVVGFTINHLIELREDFQRLAILTYPLTIDLMITCFLKPYVYISQFLTIESELSKNFFTLQDAQIRKIRK